MQKLITLLVLSVFVAINSSLIARYPHRSRGKATLPQGFDKAMLGRFIFFDQSLSNPAGLSCAGCHAPATGFCVPAHRIVSEGAVPGLFTNRNAPGISYAMYTPPFHFDDKDSAYAGGYFLDGRANSLEEQALKPFLNPLEMNNSGAAMLVKKIRGAVYYNAFRQLYGDSGDDSLALLRNVTDAIAAYEKSPAFNPFSSKYDYYLRGLAVLTSQEQRGLRLFNNEAKCAKCHPTTPDAASGKVLFTDFTYDNLGVPKNPANPYYRLSRAFNALGGDAIDKGLGGCVNNHRYDGQFRVPGLRNVAVTAPYFHNGYFRTLEKVVHFYNTRDDGAYASPEVPATVNRKELGRLYLSVADEAAIVSFLKTLTDGYK